MSVRIDPKFARYRLRVGPSRIHRHGVFALEDIPAHRRVIEYTGRRLSTAAANRIDPPQDAYLAHVNDRFVVDPSVGGSGAEFINHSCNASLEFRRIRGRLFYYSRRKIRAGEELTGNYRYPIHLRRIPCHCGARNCTGTLRYILQH